MWVSGIRSRYVNLSILNALIRMVYVTKIRNKMFINPDILWHFTVSCRHVSQVHDSVFKQDMHFILSACVLYAIHSKNHFIVYLCNRLKLCITRDLRFRINLANLDMYLCTLYCIIYGGCFSERGAVFEVDFITETKCIFYICDMSACELIYQNKLFR